MTEKMNTRLGDLKARQQKGEHMHCPRCGADTMKDPVHTNALSRVADIYICDSCGSAEAMLAFMNQQYPLTSWSAFQPDRPESDFRNLPAGDVLMKVALHQIDTLTEICKRCAEDPEHAAEYRLEAFESCPGLTELWPQPFQAKYDAADGAVLVRFKTDKNGALQITIDVCVDDNPQIGFLFTGSLQKLRIKLLQSAERARIKALSGRRAQGSQRLPQSDLKSIALHASMPVPPTMNWKGGQLYAQWIGV